MSIMSPLAVYARDLKVGKIYSGPGGMGEVQIDTEGTYYLYNTTIHMLYHLKPGQIMKIKPHPDGLFHYLRDVQG